jgi:hypothetical protein
MTGRQPAFGISGHPVAQFLSMVVLGVVLVGALIMGAFAFLALLAVFAVAYAVLRVRAWWRGRTRRGGPFDGGSGPGPAKGARYIEGEFEVIEADADATRRNSGSP